MDLNQVSLIGHVSNTPEHKTLPTGTTVTRVHLATNYGWKDTDSGEQKEKANFHSIVAWNKLGDRFNKFVKKGDRVYVQGHLDYRSFLGKDGQPKYVTNVIADKMISLEKRPRQTTSEEVEVVEIDPNQEPFTAVAA